MTSVAIDSVSSSLCIGLRLSALAEVDLVPLPENLRFWNLLEADADEVVLFGMSSSIIESSFGRDSEKSLEYSSSIALSVLM